ncbi:MAG: ABC transporter ATP-binding protein [Gemmataceae bacterium]|nr:ABC transporter ATP-binding protein [Gemmataceae bacterium]MDW8244098.1 ABC transporter ATP-binding protein [Thermogemmata sp.]
MVPLEQSYLLQLHRLGRDYGAITALNDITLSVPPGRIGLLGPNGAGKSTLLKILLGLLPPSRGSGRFLDIDLNAPARQRRLLRRLVGFMPEADALIPGLSGVEYVAFAGQLCGLSRRQALRRAHEILYLLELDEVRYRRVEEYSTGMRQRIKLAQALVHDPVVLLLDEPTSGLDPAGRDAMLLLLDRLTTEQRKSVILSTHLLADVERLCDHVVILAAGQVRACGPTPALKDPRGNRFRLDLLGPTEDFLEQLRQHQVVILERPLVGESWRVLVPSHWPTARFFALAAQTNVVIRRLLPDEETLEELFLRLLSPHNDTKPAANAPVVGYFADTPAHDGS